MKRERSDSGSGNFSEVDKRPTLGFLSALSSAAAIVPSPATDNTIYAPTTSSSDDIENSSGSVSVKSETVDRKPFALLPVETKNIVVKERRPSTSPYSTNQIVQKQPLHPALVTPPSSSAYAAKGGPNPNHAVSPSAAGPWRCKSLSQSQIVANAAALKGPAQQLLRPLPFPFKLYEMVNNTEGSYADSISWFPDGSGIQINNKERFVIYASFFFNLSAFSSFTRQLNLYGFTRIDRKMHHLGFHHPFFQRGREADLCNIYSCRVKKGYSCGGTDTGLQLQSQSQQCYPRVYDGTDSGTGADVEHNGWGGYSSNRLPYDDQEKDGKGLGLGYWDRGHDDRGGGVVSSGHSRRSLDRRDMPTLSPSPSIGFSVDDTTGHGTSPSPPHTPALPLVAATVTATPSQIGDCIYTLLNLKHFTPPVESA